MSAIDLAFGPYRYASPDHFRKVTFPSSGDVPRTFTVLVSTAYDAGIVGAEYNGLVILDDDNRLIVLDRHMGQPTGYHGASNEQLRELDRVGGMDWETFTDFCLTNKRYRGSVPDIGQVVPSPGRAPLSDRVILPGIDRPGDGCPYPVPLSTRREIVNFLSGHAGHDDGHSGFYLSWNVKVRGDLDPTDQDRAEHGLDAAFDDRWKGMVQQDESLFWQACEDGLRQWVDGEYTTYPGDDQGSYKFMVAGRQGGHLLLDRLDGQSMRFSSRHDFVVQMEDEDGFTDERLANLYKLVAACDHDLADPAAEVRHQLAFIRGQVEREWKAPAMGGVMPAPGP